MDGRQVRQSVAAGNNLLRDLSGTGHLGDYVGDIADPADRVARLLGHRVIVIGDRLILPVGVCPKSNLSRLYPTAIFEIVDLLFRRLQFGSLQQRGLVILKTSGLRCRLNLWC